MLPLTLSLKCVSRIKARINIRNMHLLNKKAFINGDWVDASSCDTFKVTNPANDIVIAEIPDMDIKDTTVAIQAASQAFQTWQDYTAKERAQLLRKWFELAEQNKESLAAILTAESGKPLSEARGEVTYGNSFLEWFSHSAQHLNGEIVPSPWRNKQMLITHQPIGVVSVITPWNFPHAMITRKVGAILAAGCTCVIKPAEDTPLTALAGAQLAHEAGIPKGVINVITSSRKHAPDVGKLLCESPLVAGVSFTGSTAVGKILYQQCATGIKRVSLELGGNAPFIVFPSANMDVTLENAMLCKFRNNGQTCVCANRFFIHEDVYSEFVTGFADLIKKRMVLGNGADNGVTAGPLINEAQLLKVSSLVNDAISKGAKVVIGGKPAPEFGTKYFEPTILTDVTPEMEIYHEEVFGPVAVVLKFKEEEEMLKIANGTRSGLASYLFTRDVGQVFRVSKKLEFGMVGINEGVLSTAEAAFGGVKESGIGREGGSHGIQEHTYLKYHLLGGLE